MAETMRPIPFARMLEWIAGEYRKQGSIFGIPEGCFFRQQTPAGITLFGEDCDTPIGPAAGPHTQLAQNIVAAYLVGGRFIELKTVQKLDSLKIDKPCIDARDEGYNTEWSTELSLEQAFEEYVKAWLLLHFLERVFGLRKAEARSFLFNMSVGYDLEGIRTERMQSFIEGLKDASEHELFRKHLRELDAFLGAEENLAAFGRVAGSAELEGLPGDISARISDSATLSTMHGCPPREIEAICSYLMKEKGLHTFVKLNPTLLGYEAVRVLLDAGDFGYVAIQETTFAKDLQYPDAVKMTERLMAAGAACGRRFGVKLSNTLAARNVAGVLPGDEMYLSGRALFPITITVASMLARQFHGTLPISFSGGASQLNAGAVFEAGIRPITMATDLLKPGGYLRMRETATLLEPLLAAGGQSETIDADRLSRIAEESAAQEMYRKAWRGDRKVSVPEKLPLLDCYVAPCMVACPIRQNVPEYIRLAGSGRFDEALEAIYRDNPLPNITGHICDHQCMYNCTRNDYEGPVSIREVKRVAARRGRRAYRVQARNKAGRLDTKAAVIGAGPAGLAAAFFLARAGLKVTVFEKNRSAGGVVGSILPRFRIREAAIRKDIRTIESMGVDFHFGVAEGFSIQTLRSQGFKHIFIGTGAEVSRKLELGGDNEKRYDALTFLRSFHASRRFAGLGRRVAVIGGGNTAVDSARAAMRVKGVEEVVLIYRRTAKEMPADREELDNALKDGVKFEYLLSPETFDKTGALRCRKMRLGEADSSGRRRPEPTDELRELPFDSLISAIGEHADFGLLQGAGMEIDVEGKWKDIDDVHLIGDAFRGPSTVVESISDAKRAVASILKEEVPDSRFAFDKSRFGEIYAKKGKLLPAGNSPKSESLRCLECDSVCNKCVDVCPNRANLYIPVPEADGFRNPWQVLHLDALCNECGNCATFCPYEGRPYKDKLTLFASKEDFERSDNSGFFVDRMVHVRLDGARWDQLPGQGSENAEAAKVLALVNTVIREHGYLLSSRP
jgi:putative selenate reductase